MSLIEGFGDEVTILFATVLIIVVISFAWMSTRVEVGPHPSIVIIDRDRFVELLRRLRGIPSQPSSGVNNSAEASQPVGDGGIVRTSDNSSDQSQDNVSASDVNSGHSLPDAAVGVESTESATSSSSSDGSSGESTTVTSSETSSVYDALSSASSRLQDDSNLDATTTTSKQCGTAEQQQPNSSPSTSDASCQIQIRLQYIDGRQKTVTVNPDDTIGQLKRCHFADELAANSAVRLIARGQELRDEASTLRSLHLGRTGAVIHCLVTPARSSQSSGVAGSNTVAANQFDVGVLVFPLFGSVLAALWYARIMYRGYFNGTSTVSLLAISFLYLIALFASFRNTGHVEQQRAHAHSN